jgi:membrane protease YdiL (CAAX protease family)
MYHKTEEWIRRHPIVAFFLLGIAMCFGLLFPAILISQQGMFGQILSFYLGGLGAYSPVVAGMLVARIVQPGKQQVPLVRRLSVFLPVWLVASLIRMASLRLMVPPSVPLFGLLILSLPVALLPALVISSAFSGTEGVKHLLATLFKPRGSIVYYLIALLTFPVIHIVGTGITNVVNGSAGLPRISQGADLASAVFITFFSVLLFSGGINEEAGWRGFAQLRLQARYNPLVANLILWFLMVIWHIPNDIVQYRDSGYLMVRIGLYPFITILFGWIFNRTRGSILAPAIFHASMNSMNPLMGVFPITTAGNILLIGLALVAIVSDRMWRRLPEHHPAVYQETAPSISNAEAVAAD